MFRPRGLTDVSRLAAAFMLLLALCATPAHASSGGRACHAVVSAGSTTANWICGDWDWRLTAAPTVLRFTLDPAARAPGRFVTRLTRFSAVELTSIAADGGRAKLRLTEADMRPATDDWQMSAALPNLPGRPAVIYARIEGARHTGMLSEARLDADDAPPAVGRFEVLIAVVCGLICAPLLFNLAFYRVLKERFLLWHSAAVLFMLVQTVVTSGLINLFVALPLFWLCVISAGTFAGGVVAAAMFSVHFIEPHCLLAGHVRLLRAAALWVPGWTAFYLFAGESLRAIAPMLYFASFLAVLAGFAWVMISAYRAGSRAVVFQIAAWSPLMLTGAIRLVSTLGLTERPYEMIFEQHLAIALEVVVTTFGVIDRFMILRRQRDHARFEARELEGVAERDPLTGLLNRRGVEPRFAEFHAAGFTTMAVIDLDHFKAVNDGHGHAAGDRVLRAVAEALAPDPDTVVMRMGGEEFMLLLRGPEAAVRAERRRQAIPARIVADVPGLEQPVTASMGLVEHDPLGRLRGEFVTLYERCDRLLYEAKRDGRNRTAAERMQSFGRMPKGSRARAA